MTSTLCKNDGSLHIRLDGAPVGTVVICSCYFCVQNSKLAVIFLLHIENIQLSPEFHCSFGYHAITTVCLYYKWNLCLSSAACRVFISLVSLQCCCSGTLHCTGSSPSENQQPLPIECYFCSILSLITFCSFKSSPRSLLSCVSLCIFCICFFVGALTSSSPVSLKLCLICC